MKNMTRLNNKWFRCILLFVVLVAIVRPCLAVDFSPVYTSINGRDFGYYVPESYDGSKPVPLLFMFHGAGGNISEASGGSAENGYYGWQSSAHENGFIVLFPQGVGFFNLWSLGSNSSDLDFVDDMIGWAAANYNISRSHMFTTGHSWGAYFSYCVARWRSDDIAAFAEHSGGISSIPVPSLASGPTPKLNGILLHAVDDGLVNYSGTQNLYNALLANGHNVYDDGIGADGIIEVDGWGPDNHRYRLVHNQAQWDFFMSVAPGILKPATLINPTAVGSIVVFDGAFLTCQESENAVGYQVLVGSDPHSVLDYTILSDTPTPPTQAVTGIDEEATYWTIEVRDQFGSIAYADPITLNYLAFTDYELVSEKSVSQTEFEYTFRVKAKNMGSDEVNRITVELHSVPDNITALNGKVFFESLPGGGEVLSDDTFSVRIDHSMPTDENDLIWQISGEREPYLAGDIDRNYMVDSSDLEILADYWLDISMNIALSGYWPLDESFGNIAADMSANVNEGTVSGGAEWMPSEGVNGALSFDGDDYVMADGVCDDIAADDLTLSLWIKSDSIASQQFVASFNTVTGGNRLLLGHPSNMSNLYVYDGGWKDTGVAVFDGSWRHVVCVLDNAGNRAFVYVDGSNVYEYSTSTSIAADDLFSLGQEYDGGPVVSDFYIGLIDEVRVYDRVLVQEEIQLLYNNPSGDPNHEGVDLFDLSDFADIAKHWLMQY